MTRTKTVKKITFGLSKEEAEQLEAVTESYSTPKVPATPSDILRYLISAAYKRITGKKNTK